MVLRSADAEYFFRIFFLKIWSLSSIDKYLYYFSHHWSSLHFWVCFQATLFKICVSHPYILAGIGHSLYNLIFKLTRKVFFIISLLLLNAFFTPSLYVNLLIFLWSYFVILPTVPKICILELLVCSYTIFIIFFEILQSNMSFLFKTVFFPCLCHFTFQNFWHS